MSFFDTTQKNPQGIKQSQALAKVSRKEERMSEQTAARTDETSQKLEQVWADHLYYEFVTRDVEATLATMTDDASINGGWTPVAVGKEKVRELYNDFIPSWPDDVQYTSPNRIIGEGQLMEEQRVTFTHSKPMNWLLPNVLPTNKQVDIVFVLIVQFRGDRIASERVYWNHATVLQQVGLL